MASRTFSFEIFDADNHMYETVDALTKFIPDEYEGVIKYVEVNGRTKIAVNNVISDYIPNPTFNVVAAPGAQEEEFRARQEGRDLGGKGGRMPPIRSIPAYFAPEPRLELMTELGLDRSIMWPTLASVVEERLPNDPLAIHAIIHALNEWMYETWTFNYADRIYATPVITLPVVEKAIEELEWVLERGAKIILIRPAPVPGFAGPRSFALPEFDPFWERVQQSGVLVGMHASDSGYQKYLNHWEGGGNREFRPFETFSTFSMIISGEHRPIFDTIASIIGHGLASRFPDIRFAPVENGSGWVRPLLSRLERMYSGQPQLFMEDPVAALKRSIVVHPFHEEDPMGLIDLVGVDNVIFGSDYPHPEGMADPVSFVDQLEGLPEEDIAKVMGGNIARLIGVDAG